jgi:hypothetical protein
MYGMPINPRMSIVGVRNIGEKLFWTFVINDEPGVRILSKEDNSPRKEPDTLNRVRNMLPTKGSDHKMIQNAILVRPIWDSPLNRLKDTKMMNGTIKNIAIGLMNSEKRKVRKNKNMSIGFFFCTYS